MAAVIRHVVVTGRVQGVGYRMWVAEEAAAHGLRGWVRNRRDGSVEAVFAGDEDGVAAMIAACRRGPPMARVEALVESEANAGLLNLSDRGFETLPTV